MTAHQDGVEQPVEQASGEFFAVDRGVWERVCALGLNPAVAYLVLARFSGLSNATTAASVNAIETYTNISRGRARTAIEQLCSSGIVTRTKGGAHPRYSLLPDGISGTGGKKRKPGTPLSSSWIWLPNTLVTSGGQQPSPVERVRAVQDSMLLKLLVELYDVQNLREDGGISRKVMFRKFTRERISETKPWVVWGFGKKSQVYVSGGTTTDPHAPIVAQLGAAAGARPSDPFRDRFMKLYGLQLVDWAPYVCESDSVESEPVHPYGTHGSQSIEDQIGRAAHAAGCALLNRDWLDYVKEHDLHTLPAHAHLDRLELIGIARMRHRPRTKLTAAWSLDLHATGKKWVETYERIVRERLNGPNPRPADLPQADQLDLAISRQLQRGT